MIRDHAVRIAEEEQEHAGQHQEDRGPAVAAKPSSQERQELYLWAQQQLARYLAEEPR